MKTNLWLALCLLTPFGLAIGQEAAPAAPAAPVDPRPIVGPGYDDTAMIPGTEWRVHDNRRPHPAIVTPGTDGSAPSDAVVLFDGTDFSHWQGPKGEPTWKLENGYMEVANKGGQIRSKEEFGDCQLHVEWASPNPPKGESQGRGNSGVFLMGCYEIQVLDCYENKTYADGQTASIYGQMPPEVNACRPPGEWQSYDIIFTAPVFKDGKLESPAYITLLHNGVLVHNHVALIGRTAHKNLAKYSPHGPKGPICLQDHGNPVRYRNIWVRPLPPAPPVD